MGFDNRTKSSASFTEVETYAYLPDASEHAGQIFLVLTATGTWLLGTKRKAGLYRSTGSEWVYMGSDVVIDDTQNSTEKAYSSSKVSTDLSQKVDKVTGSSLVPDTKVSNYDSHLTDTSNPHGVTKSQVGLANVDNTSDADKPVSTATQTALNGKANKAHTHAIADVTELQSTLNTKADAATYLPRVSAESAVMAASGGNMRLIWDNADKPSYMYRVPLGLNGDVGLPGTGVHPSFIVNGATIREFWVGAFPASLDGGKAYSIPGVDPAANINFDNSFNACTSKGAGWHMMSNAEWGYIQAWCMANGYQPRGNTNWGRAYDRVLETGTRPEAINPGVASGHGRTLTGSGPHTWRHNGMEFGIADLVGNVWEWCSGMRLMDGEIQIIPNNDAAAGVDNTASSTLWKAILADGSLVAPGTAGTIKYTSASGTVYNNVVATASNDLLKQLGLLPNAGGHIGTFYITQTGETLPIRGGARHGAAHAGLSALSLSNARSFVFTGIGFRPAFVDL